MITKKLFLLFTLFFVFSTSAQQFDLNNIKIDDVKNTLQSVLGKTEKKTNQVLLPSQGGCLNQSLCR